jgi:NAD(P)-dependent dehydrogenase (short-subunit alcohol dehydrogenase family)
MRRYTTVVMLNRRSERATAAAALVAAEATAGGGVLPVECDLSDFSSVLRAAAELQAKCQDTGIDVLCNNAVGRCSLTVSKSELKAPMVPALDTTM